MAEFHLISDAIDPVPEALAASGAPGEPGLPMRFLWRGREFAIAEVVEKWRETGGCRHGSGERYVRKHWFHIRTAEGVEMKIYFERQTRSGKGRRSWRL